MLREAGAKTRCRFGWMVAAPYALAVVGMLVLGRTLRSAGASAAGIPWCRGWSVHCPGSHAFGHGQPHLAAAGVSCGTGGNVVGNALYWNLPHGSAVGRCRSGGHCLHQRLRADGRLSGPHGLLGKLFAMTGSPAAGLYLSGVIALGSLSVLLISRRLVPIGCQTLLYFKSSWPPNGRPARKETIMQAGTSRTISEARETLGQPANLYELSKVDTHLSPYAPALPYQTRAARIAGLSAAGG